MRLLVTFQGHRNTAAESADNHIKDDQVDPAEPQSSLQIMPVTVLPMIQSEDSVPCHRSGGPIPESKPEAPTWHECGGAAKMWEWYMGSLAQRASEQWQRERRMQSRMPGDLP